MSHNSALEYFHIALAAFDALHQWTSIEEVQEVTDELRAMNAEHPMLQHLDGKIRRLSTVHEILGTACRENEISPRDDFARGLWKG